MEEMDDLRNEMGSSCDSYLGRGCYKTLLTAVSVEKPAGETSVGHERGQY